MQLHSALPHAFFVVGRLACPRLPQQHSGPRPTARPGIQKHLRNHNSQAIAGARAAACVHCGMWLRVHACRRLPQQPDGRLAVAAGQHLGVGGCRQAEGVAAAERAQVVRREAVACCADTRLTSLSGEPLQA